MDMDLRKYLLTNHHKLEWKERIKIIFHIINALIRIHQEKEIHRDLHSGNILHSPRTYNWYISDLGFCGPVNKQLGSIYGNLPYIAPEVISGKEYTFKSDIYSIGILMWEISSGQPPFINVKHDYDLAMNIVNGMRPKIVPRTPSKYKSLMEQCWDADPGKRPDSHKLYREIQEINKVYYQNTTNRNKNVDNIVKRFFKSFNLFRSRENNNLEKNLETYYTYSKLFTSKLYQFESFPEPKNATEGKL